MQFFENGKKVRYNPYNMRRDKKLGSGLEVDVYQVGDEVVKFIKRYPGKKILLDKNSIEKMRVIGTKRILLPTTVLLDKKHEFRGYKMDYVENIGIDSYISLNKEDLVKENSLFKEDLTKLSDEKVLIEDLSHENTSYHNGIYLIDPGSCKIDNDLDSNQVFGINLELVNHYLIYSVLRNYVLNKYQEVDSYRFSREVNKEYNNSGKNYVLEFFDDIKEEKLSEFVENRIKH